MSSSLPPPPPGYNDVPEAPAEVLPPPPIEDVAPEEVHESDVLKRAGRFSWKKFGGDGFMVSLAVHIILALLAIFWVVSTYTENKKKGDPDVFATGAGGGNNGDKAKMFEHRMKTRNMAVKLPSRIVSKNPNSSVSLPSTPNTATAAFSTGLSSGGMSKGSGGGSGGGEGTGMGIGKGGGRNLVTLFGAIGPNANGIPGNFYDCKQKPDGKPSPYADDSSNEAFVNEVLRPLIRKFDQTRLTEKFFKAPDQLALTQMLIPHTGAEGAPAAYGVQDKCKGRRWVAVYSGLITAPKTGKFRFWGLGDDSLVVAIDGKIRLDAGWFIATEAGGSANHGGVSKVLGVTETKKGNQGAVYRAGPWIDFTKGRDARIDISISEIPGGMFGAWLFMEEAGPDGKGDGQLFLVRFTDDELPEGLRDNSGLNVDITGKGLVWKGRGVKNSRSVR